MEFVSSRCLSETYLPYSCEGFLDSIVRCLVCNLHSFDYAVVIGDLTSTFWVIICVVESFYTPCILLAYAILSNGICTREVKSSKTVINNIFTNISQDSIESCVFETLLSDHHAQEATIYLCTSIVKSSIYFWLRLFKQEHRGISVLFAKWVLEWCLHFTLIWKRNLWLSWISSPSSWILISLYKEKGWNTKLQF